MVGATGLEPATYGTQNRRATKLRYAPTIRIVSDPLGLLAGSGLLGDSVCFVQRLDTKTFHLVPTSGRRLFPR